jgi:hypothetical protein
MTPAFPMPATTRMRSTTGPIRIPSRPRMTRPLPSEAGEPARPAGRRRPAGTHRLAAAVLLLSGLLAGAGPLLGQAGPASGADASGAREPALRPPVLAEATPAGAAWAPLQEVALPISPRGAFLRSLVLPGWGHLAVNAPGRAGFYMAAQGGTVWMLGKSILRQRSASRFRDAEFDLVQDELRARGIQSPDSLRLLTAQDPRVERWDDLVDIRGEQVEDWLALGIFLSLLGATDALVAAHMADYPEPLRFSVTPRLGPGASPGGWELRLRLPFAVPGDPRR